MRRTAFRIDGIIDVQSLRLRLGEGIRKDEILRRDAVGKHKATLREQAEHACDKLLHRSARLIGCFRKYIKTYFRRILAQAIPIQIVIDGSVRVDGNSYKSGLPDIQCLAARNTAIVSTRERIGSRCRAVVRIEAGEGNIDARLRENRGGPSARNRGGKVERHGDAPVRSLGDRTDNDTARRARVCTHRKFAVCQNNIHLWKIVVLINRVIGTKRACLGIGKCVGQNQIRGRDAPGKRESVGLYRFENRRAEIRHRLASRAAVVIVERIPRHIVDQQRSVFIIFDILCIDRDRDKTGRIQKTVPFSAVHFVARFGILVVKSQQARIPCV